MKNSSQRRVTVQRLESGSSPGKIGPAVFPVAFPLPLSKIPRSEQPRYLRLNFSQVGKSGKIPIGYTRFARSLARSLVRAPCAPRANSRSRESRRRGPPVLSTRPVRLRSCCAPVGTGVHLTRLQVSLPPSSAVSFCLSAAHVLSSLQSKRHRE